MGKAQASVWFDFPDLLGAFEKSQDRIERTIAATVQFQVGMRFDNEGAYNGHQRWEPLKFRQGQILSLSGTLRKSIAPPDADGKPGQGGFVKGSGPLTDFLVEVGTKLIYASVHDRGAIIKPKTKQALRFSIGGGKFIFAKSVTIPARPFTDINAKDEDELSETLANLIADIIDGAT